MFKHYFEGIPYIEVAPIIGLVIFFLFFIGLLFWVFTVDKSYLDEMKDLPLEDNEVIKTET